MKEIQKIKETIISDLFKSYDIRVVDADNDRRRPNLPYATIKTLSHSIVGGQAGNYKAEFVDSQSEDFKYDIKETLDYQPTATISMQAIGKDEEEAREMAGRLHDYFKFVGRPRLDGINATVVDVGDIEDRTIPLFDDLTHDFKYGLDVKIRYLKIIERTAPNIEKYKMKGHIGRLEIEQEGEINGK